MFRVLTLVALLLAVSISNAAGVLAGAPDQIRPVLLGTKLPAAALTTLDGTATTLESEVGGKPAILVFYRGGWCPYCNLQLSDLRLIKEEVEALGYQIIAISPDRPEELNKTLDKGDLDYKLLSDSKAEALSAFGIGYRLDDATREKYKGFGVDLEEYSGESHHGLPVPSVFIVDGEGLLQFSYIHPDYKARVPGNVVLAAAKSIAERKHYPSPKK